MSRDTQILRTGVLFKKGSGAGPFGRRNWKPRYFVLTPSRLQYFTFENGELKGELSLRGCDEGVLEVMPADSMKTGSSASTIWRVAINAPERRLLVAAGTEMEMNDWVDKLVMAFRINSGQPLQRASMPAPASSPSRMAGGTTSGIRDFQNFAIPRRGGTQRYSTGTDVRPSVDEQKLLIAQAESVKQQQMAEKQRLRDEEAQVQQVSWQQELEQQEEQMQRQQQQEQQLQQEVELCRQLAVQKEQEEAALAAADELHRQKEQEKQMQLETERQHLRELHHANEVARMQHEHEQEVLRNKQLADELIETRSSPSDDLLALQRRQKREEHARERAERKHAVQQQQQQEDLVFRMSQLVDPHLSEDVRLSTASRSSLVGDVKREMIQKQQQEHQRRREAALQQEHQLRQQEAARGKPEASCDVEVAPREMEVVRRAPVPKPVVPTGAPMESYEF